MPKPTGTGAASRPNWPQPRKPLETEGVNKENKSSENTPCYGLEGRVTTPSTSKKMPATLSPQSTSTISKEKLYEIRQFAKISFPSFKDSQSKKFEFKGNKFKKVNESRKIKDRLALEGEYDSYLSKLIEAAKGEEALSFSEVKALLTSFKQEAKILEIVAPNLLKTQELLNARPALMKKIDLAVDEILKKAPKNKAISKKSDDIEESSIRTRAVALGYFEKLKLFAYEFAKETAKKAGDIITEAAGYLPDNV